MKKCLFALMVFIMLFSNATIAATRTANITVAGGFNFNSNTSWVGNIAHLAQVKHYRRNDAMGFVCKLSVGQIIREL